MLTPEECSYLERVARLAAEGATGAAGAVHTVELEATFLLALVGIGEAAYQRGVDASMIQLSIVPDLVRSVG